MVLKKVFIVLIVCMFFLPISVFSSDGEKGVTQDWLSKVVKNIEKGEYKPSIQKRDYKGEEFSEPKCHFTNRAKHLRAYLDKNYIDIMPRKVTNTDNWHLRHYINSINKGIEPEILRDAILYNDKDITLKYTNSEEGIKQEILIKNKPEEKGDLLIRWDIETEGLFITEVGDNFIKFSPPEDKYEIIYKIQSVEDKDGNTVKGAIVLEGNGRISIHLNDMNANYPIRMKLLITTNREKAKEEGLFIKNNTKGLDTIPDWTGESNQEEAYFGISVSTAGDVNGDGYSDVIVGAYGYDNGETYEGRAFVYYGSSSGLSITADWTAESNQVYANFGNSVSTAGDVNGDGYSDVIVGASRYDNGETDEGAAFVYYGSGTGLSTSPDWTGESNQEYAYFGNSVSTAGDVNGDGYSDVIVGAYSYDNGQIGEGRAFVYYGSDSGLSITADWTAESNQADARFGYSVSTAGDVNGDGYSDVIVGADRYDNVEENEGRAFVYYGSGTGLSTSPDWTVESNQENAYFGVSVSIAGDVNGDGYSDVIVGADRYDNVEEDEGRAFVYYGSGTGLSISPDWTGESNQEYASFGYSVSTAGDVNGDGYSDVIVGAHAYDNGQTNEGRAFVYYGSGTGLSTSPDWTGESNQAHAYFGVSVSIAGDVNGDGYSDVIVGAHSYDNGETNEGAAFVYYGSGTGLSITADWIAESNQAYADFGNSVSTAGDVNGDGYSDVIVGAYGYDNGETDEGRAFVYYGSGTGLSISPDWTGESNQEYASFGYSISTAGDVNGDGYSDVIVGAFGYDNGQAEEGRAFVYYGSDSGLSITADWTGESNQATAYFGISVSQAGDVNGDGYSDVIVGACYYDNGQTDEGKAFVYYGSGTGLSTTPDWTGESNQVDARFGWPVSTAGDVNGDGYSDVIVGAYHYDNGETDEGRAFVYYGSGSGLSVSSDWTGEPNQEYAHFGRSVSTAGDVNGDGYSDVIVGAYGYDNEQTDEGAAFVYYGNSGGLALIPGQAISDGSHLIQLLNASGSNDVRLQLLGRIPAGRGKVKLQWEIKELGQLFSGTGLGISSAWYDTYTSGIEIDENISGLKDSTAYHWRVRLVYSPLTYNGSIYSRWLSIGPNGWNETDFITTTLSGINEREEHSRRGLVLNITPIISRGVFRIMFNIPTKDDGKEVSLKIYDVTGRVVKEFKSLKANQIMWRGDDNRGLLVGSGVYFVGLYYGNQRLVNKVLLVK